MALGYTVTVLVFQGKRSEPVLSRDVKRALDRESISPCAREGKLVALAPDFTTDAEALLACYGFEALTLAAFGWTDESWKRIHAGISISKER
jgi:hypothetical protein